MKTPPRHPFTAFFRRLPRWVVPLIIALLFGRFILIFLFHLWS